MTEDQAFQIRELRREGAGYVTIAEIVGIPRDNVRDYCMNHGLNGPRAVYLANLNDRVEAGNACLYCGAPIKRKGSGRPRKFCSDKCRRKYWNAHRDETVKHSKLVYTLECPYCHKLFTSYGNGPRKYCCHEHYILDRYGHDSRVKAPEEKSSGAFSFGEGEE